MQSIKQPHAPHANLYDWPSENNSQSDSANSVHSEFRLQLLLLSKRVDLLSNMLKQQLNDKQQKNLQQLLEK